MIFSILLLTALIALVAFGIRKVMTRGSGGPTDAHAVRRFFHYVVLYGLLVLAAVGVSGLLTRVLDRSALATDRSALALSLTYTLVGVPLYAGMAAWTRHTFTREQTAPTPGAEARSLGWACYVTAACLTGLAYLMMSLYGVLAWAAGLERYDPAAVAGLPVWGAIWAGHWYLDRRVTLARQSLPHHLLGSLAGLGTSTAALAILAAGTIEAFTGISDSTGLVENDNRLLRGTVLLVVGAPTWLLYWWRTAARSPRNPLWFAYVLLAGVAGGLITTVVGASIAVYDTLVWFLGQPWSDQATVHFRSLPAAVGAAAAGALVWWYHHTLVRIPARKRPEVVRVYEYLMAATGLVAAVIGLTMVIVALVEAITSSVALLGTTAVNTLLAAATIMLVGGPVWVVFWRRIELSTRAAPAEERTSPTRRVYLLVLFGVAGIAAVVALLVGVYAFAQNALTGSVGAQTLNSMRFPIGILISTGLICGYHATVYRADRADRAAAGTRPHGPRFVLLVGPQDPQIAQAVAQQTGGRVQTWRTDDGVQWTADGVLAALEALGASEVEEVVVVSEADGAHAIPVHRH